MAHWHIFLPFRLTFENRGAMNEVFQSHYKNNFGFEKSKEYLIPSRVGANGRKYVFGKVEESHTLNDRVVQKEFINFYRLFTHEFRKLYGGENRQFDSVLFQTDALLSFVLQLDKLYLNGFQEKHIQDISSWKENQFVKFMNLTPSKVIEGYPLPTHYSSQIQAISLLSSSKMMNASYHETVAFHNFVEHIQQLCKEKYELTKYLFVAGV